MTRWLSLVAVALVALAAAACGESVTPTSPSIPDEAVDAATRLFTGTLPPRGSTFYAFSVPQDSGVFLTLASVRSPGQRDASAVPLALGLGVPRGTGCAVDVSVVGGADLAAQIREWRRAGVQCVSVVDPGTLAGEVSFAVRIGYFQ